MDVPDGARVRTVNAEMLQSGRLAVVGPGRPSPRRRRGRRQPALGGHEGEGGPRREERLVAEQRHQLAVVGGAHRGRARSRRGGPSTETIFADLVPTYGSGEPLHSHGAKEVPVQQTRLDETGRVLSTPRRSSAGRSGADASAGGVAALRRRLPLGVVVRGLRVRGGSTGLADGDAARRPRCGSASSSALPATRSSSSTSCTASVRRALPDVHPVGRRAQRGRPAHRAATPTSW